MAAARTTHRASDRPRIPIGAPSGRRRLAATVARWPVDVEDGFEVVAETDHGLAIVRRSIADYRAGRADRAALSWDDAIAWRVLGDGPLGGEWVGRERVFDYHRAAERLTDGDYHQRLLALEGGEGRPFVEAHLRTTGTRRGRRLDVPTLLVFELASGRIRSVTEIPGDLEAWRAFWDA